MKKEKIKEERLMEVARSFSWTLQIEPFNPRNFFCSLKREVPESEMLEASKELYDLCRSEVEKSVKEYQEKDSLENNPFTLKEKEEIGDLAREENFKADEDFKKRSEEEFNFKQQ